MRINLYICTAIVFFAGCFQNNKTQGGGDKYVIITAALNMNKGTNVRVEIVQVYEEYIWNGIKDLTAQQYFKNRSSVTAKKVTVWQIDVTPDFWCKCIMLDGFRDQSIGMMLFTSYTTTDPDKITKVPLTNKGDCTLLTLGENGIDSAKASTFPVADYVVAKPICGASVG